MKRKVLLIISLTVSAFLFLGTVQRLATTVCAYPGAAIYVNPAAVVEYTNETSLGSTFQVALGISNVTDLQSIQFTLYWNRSLLNVVSVQDTLPFFGNPSIIDNVTNNNYNATYGQMSFSANSTTASFTGNAVFRQVILNITNAPAPVNGSFLASAISWGPYGTETVLSNSTGMIISAITQDGEFSYYYEPIIPEYTTSILLLAFALATSIIVACKKKQIARAYKPKTTTQ
jgi:hypothetical protein